MEKKIRCLDHLQFSQYIKHLLHVISFHLCQRPLLLSIWFQIEYHSAAKAQIPRNYYFSSSFWALLQIALPTIQNQVSIKIWWGVEYRNRSKWRIRVRSIKSELPNTPLPPLNFLFQACWVPSPKLLNHVRQSIPLPLKKK